MHKDRECFITAEYLMRKLVRWTIQIVRDMIEKGKTAISQEPRAQTMSQSESARGEHSCWVL